MSSRFCARTERRLRRLGYDKRIAHRYAGFFFVSMMSVCGVMISGMRRRRGQKGITEEIPRSLRHVLAMLLEQMHSINGFGIIAAGPRAALFAPALFSYT